VWLDGLTLITDPKVSRCRIDDTPEPRSILRMTSKTAPTEKPKRGGNRAAKLRAEHDALAARRKAKEDARVKRAARDAKRMAGENVGSGRTPALLPTDEVLKQLESLGGLDCTHVEVAAFFSVSRETLEQFLGRHIKAQEAYENGRAKGCISLRRVQVRLAEKNAAMAIWLGKQRLQQKDVVEVTNEDGPRKAASAEETKARVEELMLRMGWRPPEGEPVRKLPGVYPDRDGADEFPILRNLDRRPEQSS